MTLVIMAAGMGSRYGGLKQLDPMTPHGEFIIDFSAYDALQAGFDRIVFVVKRENLELFKDSIGRRISKRIRVEYVCQDLDALPEGLTVPEGRVKPWGTAHAVLCASDIVDEGFAVINADDFYGRDAFCQLAAFLSSAGTNNGKAHFAMVGYVLENTLTENGHVSRGICVKDMQGMLTSVTERTKIQRIPDGTVAFLEEEQWHPLTGKEIVSMNCWAFSPALFAHIREHFPAFFRSPSFNPEKSEYYLPTAVTEMMDAGTADVRLMETDARWYGVTYHEDKPNVLQKIREMVESGLYPDGLWN